MGGLGGQWKETGAKIYRGGPPDVTDPPTWRKQTNQTSGVMPANRLAAVMLATGVLMRSGMPIISSQNQIQNVT